MMLPEDFEELIAFAKAHYGASAERAEVIVANHADEMRAFMKSLKGVIDAEKEAAPKEESGATEKESDTPAE